MLGICVVYLVPDKDAELLLKFHLANLKATTEGPYRIYGVALRMPPAQAEALRESGVVLPDIPLHDPERYARNNKYAAEHSHYLDQLVDFAFGDGCTHVASFDMDSWPIAKGWDAHYLKFLTPQVPVIGMRRTETNDEFPNPAFTLMRSGFWRPGQTSFAFFNPRCDYQKSGLVVRAHSGVGILAELTLNGQTYLPLMRTNRWNPHRIMCGVYDHRIFHFGAGSREPSFAGDKEEYDVIDTEMSLSYARAINGAKRTFFLDCLKRSGSEFVTQLIKGGPVTRKVGGKKA